MSSEFGGLEATRASKEHVKLGFISFASFLGKDVLLILGAKRRPKIEPFIFAAADLDNAVPIIQKTGAANE